MYPNLYFYILASIFAFFTTAYVCGMAVTYKGIRVNYTRKINHFVQFLLPAGLVILFPHENSLGTFFLETSIFLIGFFLFIKPIRSQNKSLQIMFSSFDRPEDQPYTLRWVVIQFISAFIAIIPLQYYAFTSGLYSLGLIPILINGFGDGLAEPVGVRFGKHRYKTKALFTKKEYYRTLEGSACVFITTIIVIIAFKEVFTSSQFLVALLLMPVVMTMTEAKSPHTMDAPYIYGIGGFILIVITSLV